MKINVNGEPVEIESGDLENTLKELGYGGAVVATAVNGEFVGAPQRAETRLEPGDRIEILAPMQGG